ncbi:hypothetical protein EI94DRAFT_1613711 [Lactarius quietus]|nr:hypothetical protein EI94DRAFT_1613711 [Lactarius quietus]
MDLFRNSNAEVQASEIVSKIRDFQGSRAPYRPPRIVRTCRPPSHRETRQLEIPEQSRVWWCPTSVLFSLRLYAAGSMESDGRAKRYFSDVYVSSYNPTHSALIESRQGITHTPDPP